MHTHTFETHGRSDELCMIRTAIAQPVSWHLITQQMKQEKYTMKSRVLKKCMGVQLAYITLRNTQCILLVLHDVSAALHRQPQVFHDTL